MNDTWETGPDAAHGAAQPPERVQARVVLLYGSQAEVATDVHPVDDPLRVPAAELARLLGVRIEELPGKRFTAVVDGERLVDVQL
jgi:hypothetical protein